MPLGVAQPSVAMVTANIGTEMVTVCFVCFLTLVQFEIRCVFQVLVDGGSYNGFIVLAELLI